MKVDEKYTLFVFTITVHAQLRLQQSLCVCGVCAQLRAKMAYLLGKAHRCRHVLWKNDSCMGLTAKESSGNALPTRNKAIVITINYV